MRDNVWIERSSWPPKTVKRRFYLSAITQSNSCEGGALSETNSGPSTSITYQYDPDNPVPTRGGAGMLAFISPGFDGAKPANVLQDGLCERDDVITFSTEPLEQDLKIVGDIGLHLSVASDAEDTAFTGKLIEIFADGKKVNMRDSITSLAYRNHAEVPQSYSPGEKVDVEFEFWPIEWSLQKGSRLRLDISSSDFAKFHAHSNKAGIGQKLLLSKPQRKRFFPA
jgi:putative CocE/NonD family hydrolase